MKFLQAFCPLIFVALKTYEDLHAEGVKDCPKTFVSFLSDAKLLERIQESYFKIPKNQIKIHLEILQGILRRSDSFINKK
jgi:hypothetical protein